MTECAAPRNALSGSGVRFCDSETGVVPNRRIARLTPRLKPIKKSH